MPEVSILQLIVNQHNYRYLEVGYKSFPGCAWPVSEETFVKP